MWELETGHLKPPLVHHHLDCLVPLQEGKIAGERDYFLIEHSMASLGDLRTTCDMGLMPLLHLLNDLNSRISGMAAF